MAGQGTSQKGSPQEPQQFPVRSSDRASRQQAPSAHNNKQFVTNNKQDGPQQEPADSVRAQGVPTPRLGSYAPPLSGFALRQDGWSKPVSRPLGNYHYSPLGMYGHTFGSDGMMDYEQPGYGPYPLPSPGHRRAVNETRRGDMRYSGLLGINSIGAPESRPGVLMGKMPRMGMHSLNLQGNLSGLSTTTAAWYERSAASYEKSKEIFEYMSKRCDSNDCTHIDQEKLVTVTKERTVRQLDFNAASQAMNAISIAEKKWSTEPNGEGFRTYAKDLRGLIEHNSIDAMRMMYPMSEDGGPQCEAQNIAEAVEEASKRAAFMKDYADNTAQAYGIPLNTSADTFLECAEQYYLSESSEGIYMAPSPGSEALFGRGRDMSQTLSGYFPRQEYGKPGLPKPETSLAQFAKAIMPKDNGTELVEKVAQSQGHAWKAKPPHINSSILMKDRQPQASAVSFDVRSSQWWNPTQDGFSPKVDSFGQPGNPVWGVNDDLFQSGFNDGLEEMSSGMQKDFNHIIQTTEKTSSSKGAERIIPKAPADGEQDLGGQQKNAQAPLCYCGQQCTKKSNAQGFFWGCAASLCEAQMPISHNKPVEKVEKNLLKPRVTKLGRETHIPQRFAADETTSKTYANEDGQKNAIEKARGADKVALMPPVPTKVPNSIDSSGIKESGTTYRVNSDSFPQRCKKKDFCVKPPGHRGGCSTGRKRGRPRKKPIVESGIHESGPILNMDKSAPRPHEELILTRPGDVAKGDIRNSKSSQATESIKKAVEEKVQDREKPGSAKVGKNLEVTSKWAEETNKITSSDNISNESQPQYTEGESDAQAKKEQQSSESDLMREMLKEREAIPEEFRCMRDPTCLNKRGHRGRCRLRPSGRPRKRKAKVSTGEIQDDKTMKKKQTLESDRVAQPISKCPDPPTTLTSNSNEAATMKAAIPEEDATISERETLKSKDGTSGKEFADSAKENVFAGEDQEPFGKKESHQKKKYMAVAARHPSVKFLGGDAILRWEFENLSSEYIRTFYGCSQTFPASEWKVQKEAYLSQRSILAGNPPVSIEAAGEEEKKSKLAACKTVPASCTWANFATPNKALYKEDRSRIHGCGLFAVADIASGMPITELIGEFISQPEAKQREAVYADSNVKVKSCIGTIKGTIEHAKHMIFDVNKDLVLDATKAGSMAKFVNHSCSPNCEMQLLADLEGTPHIVLHACSDIKEGEELTCDYKLLSGGFSCRCGSDNCRKSI